MLESLALKDKELEEKEEATPPEITLVQDLSPQQPSPDPRKKDKDKVPPVPVRPNTEMRKWTQADGTTFEGKVVSFAKGEGVVFQSRDGKEIKMGINKLSQDDRKYIRQLFGSSIKKP